jgi:hypothetical protein
MVVVVVVVKLECTLLAMATCACTEHMYSQTMTECFQVSLSTCVLSLFGYEFTN